MDDPATITVIIAGTVTIIGAIATAAVTVIKTLREVHTAVNSRMSQLLELTRAMGVAEGIEFGRAAQLAEAATDAAKRGTP